jgi:hypothetical protein
MELLPSLLSVGWASGVNAYLTVLVLGLLGRAGVGEVPEQLTETPVLVVAGVMFVVEFVTDKVPYVDNTWDAISTLIRPAIGAAIGVEYADLDGLTGIDEALAAGGTGAIALVSHAIKASLRLGINTSPEPVSNVIASLTEDGLVVVVAGFSIDHPELAATIALVLLLVGATIVILLWTRVRRALAAMRQRWRGSP